MSCLGKTDHDLFPKSEADVFWAQDDKVFTSDQPIENEELRKCCDQDKTQLKYWIQWTFTPLKNAKKHTKWKYWRSWNTSI